MNLFSKSIRRLRAFVRMEIWSARAMSDVSWHGRFIAAIRVCMVAAGGIKENQIAVRAASLTYSSLLALGPAVALGVMVAGFLLSGDNAIVETVINRIMEFVAPQFNEAGDTAGGTVESVQQATSGLQQMFQNFIAHARSGAVGVVGSIMLIVIVIQLLTTIEKALNDIWGVERGRSLWQRVLAYWSFMSLGTILVVASASLVSLGPIVKWMRSKAEDLPAWMQSGFAHALPVLGPVLALACFTLLLALFYRFFPNTKVRWKAALVGAFAATLLIGLNYMLSFLYVSKVVSTTALYGSVGIIPVLMLGLYIFWFIILIGGQITYAVQNSRQVAVMRIWHEMGTRARDILCLAVLLNIARRFRNGDKPAGISSLRDDLHMPEHLVNSALAALSAAGLVYPVECEIDGDGFTPSKPLDAYSFKNVLTALQSSSDDHGARSLVESEPVLETWFNDLDGALGSASLNEGLDAILDRTAR